MDNATTLKPHSYTPGPWTVSGRAGYGGHIVIDRNKRSVAAFPSSSRRPFDERDANARLIAACPEMLAELEAEEANVAVLVQIAGNLPDSGDRRALVDVMTGRLARLRAIIAKAGG
jgi:hypothetical protein